MLLLLVGFGGGIAEPQFSGSAIATISSTYSATQVVMASPYDAEQTVSGPHSATSEVSTG